MKFRLSLAALLVTALPAAAQDFVGAIAFAQAPEQSSGVGLGTTTDEAIADAVQQCVDGGAMAEDCYVTAACSPAGWSADFFVQHQEGNHWHESYCGLPNERAALHLDSLVCDREERPELIECTLVQVWDEGGYAQMEW